MLSKKCKACNKIKPLDSFGKICKTRKGFKTHCKECNKIIHRTELKKYKRRNIEYLNTYKKTLNCTKCGESRWYVLDFHHVNETLKYRGISKMVQDGYSIKRIAEELEKCIPLCSNCHRELHHEERSELEK